MQAAEDVRRLLVPQIRCNGPTSLRRFQTWFLTSLPSGRILDRENTGLGVFNRIGRFRPLSICEEVSEVLGSDAGRGVFGGCFKTWSRALPRRSNCLRMHGLEALGRASRGRRAGIFRAEKSVRLEQDKRSNGKLLQVKA